MEYLGTHDLGVSVSQLDGQPLQTPTKSQSPNAPASDSPVILKIQ